MDLNQDISTESFHRSTGRSPKELLFSYIKYLPWFILSAAIALLYTFIQLRYSPNIYSVSGTMQVRSNRQAGGVSDGKLSQLLFAESGNSLSDEMQIIRSKNMARRVVEKLGFNTRYYNVGQVRTTLISPGLVPFILEIQSIKDSSRGTSLAIEVIDEQKYRIGEKGSPQYFGQTISDPSFTYRLVRTAVSLTGFATREFIITRQPVDEVAGELAGSLTVGMSGDATNILKFGYETENIDYAVAIVNQFMKEYQYFGLEENREMSNNALRFINEQIDTIQRDLRRVESELQFFREKNRVFDPQEQSAEMITSVTELDKNISEQEMRSRFLDYLENYVRDDRNLFRSGFTTLGIEDPSLGENVSALNKLQMERETLLKSTLPNNPLLVVNETAIRKLRNNILENLKSIRISYQSIGKDLRSQANKNNLEISSIPSKQKQLIEISRRQKILEELFTFLLEKKVEMSIGSASTISSSRIIESASSSGMPIKPQKSREYTFALLLGLLIPGSIIFLKEYLNDKVRSRNDIENFTRTPILGEVGHSHETRDLVVRKDSRTFIAEQFRMIRSNLQYLVPKQGSACIMVTSSLSGEGKSYVALNVAAAIALAGKKTVILEFDMRKPSLLSKLGVNKKGSGISHFIIGKESYAELIHKVDEIANLYIIGSGPIPPNPSELLLDHKCQQLFEMLKKDFEVIVIDTAPIGLVSDAMTLSKYADASLYVLRHNYTQKRQMKMVQDLYSAKKISNLALVINDIDLKSGTYDYYGYSSYGGSYSNRYAYTDGYYEGPLPHRRWYQAILKRFFPDT